ncbi:MAG: hypothetical protein JWO13_2011 [Acidobacteriales bacterium]|nr:hypothetical protein [Terriglobales bacterium]
MVRRAIRASPDKSGICVEDSGHTVNFCGLQCLFECERRENGGNPLGKHRFAGTGRPDHEDVVSASRRDFERAFGSVLSANIFEVYGKVLDFLQERGGVNGHRCHPVTSVQQVDDVEQRFHWINGQTGDDSRFARVHLRNDKVLDLAIACGNGDGQSPADSTKAAIEAQLADKNIVGQFLLVQGTVCAKNSERHGKIEAGTFLLDVRGGEIDGDVRGWDVISAIFKRSANTLTAFADGGIWEAHCCEMVLIQPDT